MEKMMKDCSKCVRAYKVCKPKDTFLLHIVFVTFYFMLQYLENMEFNLLISDCPS